MDRKERVSMRFTAQEEYGLRCILQLARHENNGPLTIDEIAKNEALTTHYVGKLMRILLKGGLIKSTRGQNGGYKLARPAVQTSVLDILNILDGPFFEIGMCSKFTGIDIVCVNTTECSVRALWSTINSAVNQILGNTMLKDLIVDEKTANKWFRYIAKPSIPVSARP